jgi:murein DD-endopeptidase MepM/ murein hydrolase activator NlpD
MGRNGFVVFLAAAFSLLASSDLAARVPDATALLNWAEGAYPQLFPRGPTNQTASPYIFRYYPQTNTYLGVAGDVVQVLGPVSGNAVVTVGKLADFSCSVYPTDCVTSPLALFDKPFAGEYPVANFLDHNIPKEFVDTNGTFVTFWGEEHPAALTNMIDGHSGYDFLMPVGTPLLAVAPGTVVRVLTSETPFFCPPLNRNVSDQQEIFIEHTLADGSKVQSTYVHLSRIDVAQGASVARGQQVGLSGTTGCSTGPHLHFEVRLQGKPTNPLRYIP